MKKTIQAGVKVGISGAKAIKDEISLTLMSVSFILVSAAGILQVFKRVDSTGPFMELFITCAGLYFGRRGVDAYFKNKDKTEEK